MRNRIEYRRINFLASENRLTTGLVIHPALAEALKRVAKKERRSVSWLIEDSLADYFDIRIELRKLKGKPKPAYEK